MTISQPFPPAHGSPHGAPAAQAAAPAPSAPLRVVVGTNGLATTSLVTALLGLSLVAVICGHIARRQIRRTGEAGDAQAVVGLVVGYLGLAATVAAVVLVVAAATLPFVTR